MLPPNLPLNQRLSRIFKFAVFGALCVVIAYLIVAIDPLTRIVKDQLSIREGSILFSVFKKPPLEVFISVYVFNVTNVAAFLSKAEPKLHVQEIGPYVYQEFLDHTNYTYHDNGTLSYFPKRRVEFVPERSVGDPKHDVVTVPNIPLLGASTAAADMSIFAALALSTLTTTINAQPMLNLTVHDYLWGYEDTLVKLAANIVPSIITFETFGLLDRMFDEGTNEVTINLPERIKRLKEEEEEKEKTVQNATESESFDPRRKVNPIREYSIDTWNGGTGLKYWNYNEENKDASENTVCNSLRGAYDGTVFPQNISKNEEFRVYRKAFCRTLAIRYDHSSELDGLEAYHFELAEDAFDSTMDDPNSSCFCKENKCLKKGLGNITPCYYNIPTAVSYPHFYRSDPSLLAGVEGLAPDADKHGSEIVLQPQLGVPMRVHSRIQINLLMDSVKFNSRVKPYEGVVLPIVWMEIAVERLTPGLIVLLHMMFNILPYVQAGIVFVLCIVGVAMFAVAALSYFCLGRRVTDTNAAIIYGKCEGFDAAASEPVHETNTKPATSRYSSIYLFPYIRREMNRCVEENCEDAKYDMA